MLQTANLVQSSTFVQFVKGLKQFGGDYIFLALEGILFSSILTNKLSQSEIMTVEKIKNHHAIKPCGEVYVAGRKFNFH